MIIDAKLDGFMAVYAEELPRVIKENPDEYAYPVSLAPTVVERMRKAIEERTYNHGGLAFKATCKRLGIKHTRKAIKMFLEGE